MGAAGAAAAPWVLDPFALGAATITARQVVERIQRSAGVEWKAATVDGFKAGDPSTAVTGIVTICARHDSTCCAGRSRPARI